MTRINLVHPSELHRKHLVAEFRELPRVFSLARKAQYDMHKRSQPNEYTLGKGHVIFWYTRLQYRQTATTNSVQKCKPEVILAIAYQSKN